MTRIRQIDISIALIVLTCVVYLFSSTSVIADTHLKRAQEIYRKATQTSESWSFPPIGSKALPNKTVVYLADNLLNGGILGVGEGVREAARVLGWKVNVIDTLGTPIGRDTALLKVAQLKPDGLILGGLNAADYVEELNTIAGNGTEIVGWHAAGLPGPIKGTPVRFNVTTDPVEVGVTAASYAVVSSNAKAGVVILTDDAYEIALVKSDAIAKFIRQCSGCTLLSVENVSLAQTDKLMPQLVDELLERYGDRWTHTIGINDLYFDFAAPALAISNAPSAESISNISAGDGSASAYDRIRANSFQMATVPEPLSLHGWQLMDELNRSFAGMPPSGYIAPVRLVVSENIEESGGDRNLFDPDNGYRKAYRTSWGR